MCGRSLASTAAISGTCIATDTGETVHFAAMAPRERIGNGKQFGKWIMTVIDPETTAFSFLPPVKGAGLCPMSALKLRAARRTSFLALSQVTVAPVPA